MTDSAIEPDFDPEAGYPLVQETLPLLPVQEQTLELIAHLAAYSEQLVVVSGPAGSGKTLLATALVERSHAADDALLLTASHDLTMPALLQQITAHWQLHLPEELPTARELVISEARQRAEEGGSLLLVVDQAEQLDVETLNDIAHFALLAPQAIGIVLLGEPGFEQDLRGGPAQAPVEVKTLPPLQADDARQLLQQVYSPGQPLPLDEQELALLLQQSQGWPGALLALADDYFAAAEVAVAPPRAPAPKAAAGRFPALHIIAIAALVTALALAFLYRQQEPEETFTVAAPQPVDILRGPLVADDSATDRAAVDAMADAEAMDDAEVTPPMVTPQAEPVLVESDNDATADNAAIADGATDYNFTAPATTAVEPPPVAKTTAEPAPAMAPAAVKPAPVAAVAAPAERPQYDRLRLLDIPAGVVVQLFGSYEAANADKFRRQWRDEIAGSLYLYETRHNNKPWFVVVAGVYGSRAEARAAVNALPRPLRAQSPWIRDVSAVKQALR